MRCIAVINQKGGVGKTTSTVNIGAALASRGNKVLLLDIDPQANLTLHLDRCPEGDGGTMTDLLVDGKPLAEMLIETCAEGLYMIPADTSLSGVETMLANRIGRETILREAIEAFDEDESAPTFDYILLDCPPSLGVLSANALVCADDIIIPMQAEYFSMQGMTKLMEVMQLVKQRLNPELSICLILPCMVDRRTNLTNEVLNELRQHFGDVLAETCIRSNVKLAEAPSFGRTIFEHAPESNGALDYAVVTDELLRRFAGTFEPAPLEEEEDEYEEEEEEDNEDVEEEDEAEHTHDDAAAEDEDKLEELVEPTELEAGETETSKPSTEAAAIDEPVVIEGIPDVPLVELAPTAAATTDIEPLPDPVVEASLHNGAPFVESVPPAETTPDVVDAVAVTPGEPEPNADVTPADPVATPQPTVEEVEETVVEETAAPPIETSVVTPVPMPEVTPIESLATPPTAPADPVIDPVAVDAPIIDTQSDPEPPKPELQEGA